MVAEGRDEADQIIAAAHEERMRLVSETEVFAQAQLEASRVRGEAAAEAESMRQQVDALLAELASGKSFEEVARKYSQDTRRSHGGDWGWLTRKDLNASLSELAFSIKAGQHSQPLTVGKQIYILYVEERRAEGVQPMADVRAGIEGKLAAEQSREAQQAWIERLRQKAYIKYY